jgi:PKD repeat protein
VRQLRGVPSHVIVILLPVCLALCCHVKSPDLPPAASFTFSPSSPEVGKSVQFTDTSTGSPTSWQWNFGDGGSSTAQNPSHAYTATGSYTVTLVAGNSFGTDSTNRTLTVVPVSAMIPADRKVEWSAAGVPGGIPGRATVYATLSAGATATQLNTAIRSCPSGQVVYLSAGNYSFSGAIYLKSGVTVRGAGPGLTNITTGAGFEAASFDSTESILFNPSDAPDAGNTSGPIVSGYGKGSSTVVVSSVLAANLSAGQIVLINQTNDPDFVNAQGCEDYCDWAAGGGTRGLGETKMIASKSGTSITFTTPIYYNYQSAFRPKLIRVASSPIQYAGIENLTVNGAGVAEPCVKFEGVAYCWAKGVEFKNWAGHAVSMSWGSLGGEVTNCYFHDAAEFGSSNGYSVSIVGNSTDNLVYDNISTNVKCMAAIGSTGGTANVVAYNFNYSTRHEVNYWQMQAYATHGIHTYMNLFEGNIGGKFASDYTHGSGSHTVALRNRFTGDSNNPAVTSNKLCVDLEAWNYYTSFVGNVLGYPGMVGHYEPTRYVNDGKTSVWKLGYSCNSEGRPKDIKTKGTMIRHGNYDYVTKSTEWDDSIQNRNIPSSLYLRSKPAWFGSLEWPAIGPDVAGYAKTTPAKSRWDAYVASGALADLF